MTNSPFPFRRPLGRLSLLLGSLIASVAGAQTVSPTLYDGLSWRCIGPFRGGRVASVTGVIGSPGVFYMGLPAGGAWQTTSAGMTWFPIMDSIKEVSSVGAIAVAPSDPNIIYVGTGDAVRNDGGNGVYKSIDAGKTWTHLGLEATKQISSILVDPHDPNLALLTAQGSQHERSPDRGVYRTTDGGKTWTRTLFVDDHSGGERIAWATDNPSVMLATTNARYRQPGARGFGNSGDVSYGSAATGTQLYKSTDEGKSWRLLSGGGLPTLYGRTSVAVAMHTQSQRMYLVGNFGLYRSDDGGEKWRRMDAKDDRIRNGQGGYNCGVYVNSQNPDLVYVINTCSYVSKDGGLTFTGFKGAPGGDDPQQMWIDPTDGQRMLLGTDQGATVSLDGGQTWSSWYNQPSAQVYHISTDNQFPYWVYGTQQDTAAVATSSRGNLGAVGPLDWSTNPGYEFGSIVADPLNPKITFAGSEARGIEKSTRPSEQWVEVSPSLDGAQNLRTVSNQPLIFSPTNPHELFAGFQYLMSTTDGGMHWKRLSPDLAQLKDAPTEEKPKASPSKAISPKPKAPLGQSNTAEPEVAEPDEHDQPGEELSEIDEEEQQRTRGGGAIESISPSSIDGNLIWVGTNNGIIKLTRDHGRTWADVSIPGLPHAQSADISAIDASHQDPAAAYVAIDLHGYADNAPYLYRTHDYGQTWTKIVSGLPQDLPSGSFARVIRADTVRSGLLFAGTESTVYVSFNDGDAWQPLALNLPTTSIRDMTIHGSDLVVGTYGRSFWVLDDFSPLRELSSDLASQSAYLFRPDIAVRVRRNVGNDTPFPPEIPHAENPPPGVALTYYLGATMSDPLTIEVSDEKGNIVRHLSSVPPPAVAEAAPPIPDFWVAKPSPLPTTMGCHRVNWDLRRDDPPAFGHEYKINANPFETPASPEGPLVAPGDYTVTLEANGKTYSQLVHIVNDPRSPANPRALRAQCDLQSRLYAGAVEAYATYLKAEELRKALMGLRGGEVPEIVKLAGDLYDKFTFSGQSATPTRFGRGAERPAHLTNFAEIQRKLIDELGWLENGDMAPNEPMRKATQSTMEDLSTLTKHWREYLAKDIAGLNALLSKHSLPPVPQTP